MSTLLLWPVNLLRDGPKRVGRLVGIAMIGQKSEALRMGTWWNAFLTSIFDLLGGPELSQLVIRSLTRTRPLTEREAAAAKRVLGSHSIRFEDVRIASGGLWTPVFKRNRGRAFASWHTINLPRQSGDNLPLIVHELVHTYQYESTGSSYIGQGLWSQIRLGKKAYDYGGNQGLVDDRAAGKQYSDYNREQQGQIAQDYCTLLLNKQDTSAYDPFIMDLQNGLL